MTDTPPNGKGVSTQEWVRDILAFLLKLIESNDKRYEERWRAQEQAISKQEAAQNGYNTAHNGLLKDNREQAQGFASKIETLLSKDEATLRLAALSERITVLDKGHTELLQNVNSHLQLAIHPGAQAQLNSLKEEVKALREANIKVAERRDVKIETAVQSKWTIERIITILFGLVGVVALLKDFFIK